MIFGDGVLNLVLDSTNQSLPQGTVKLTKGELVRFLGMQLAIATTTGFGRDEFWLSDVARRDMWRSPPYNFNLLMSKTRYLLILKHLSFAIDDPPPFRDKFWRIRQILSLWNCNMTEIFSCSFVACLDESMSLWLNGWTCPGWTFVPRKPWSMGNEYHTMCCGVTSIMFAINLVEGSDRPKELPSLDPEKKGPTVSLLLRMRKPLYTKGTDFRV